ncbi:hypothetical protein [Defluviitalea raffinosedens]|uniref:hypothetical protein n=1 Tax=Defluviitalea raffinosedens TaxID=1450156 RepID=UPI001A9C7C4F|nr:hypothetical protein [Defluviitalea raffinosedens]MBM7686900.1 hypothetical protein [Defluviitalea raffinosedens]
MKIKRYLIVLVSIIAFLSTIACLFGLFSDGGPGEYEFKSINNEIVKIYGYGLYKDNSISIAAQGIASDFVTLVMGVPLLILSLYLSLKESFKGKILLTGTLSYFLYTYMSYTFLWMYNKFFIIYVMLMSASLYAFILSISSFDIENIKLNFSEKLPVKFLGGYQIFIGVMIGMLWLGKIAPSIIGDKVPVGLEHYTTLVIQGMDLGIIVPTAILSGIFLIKRKAIGFLLSSVIIIKGITMLTSISAMIINQALHGVNMSMAEVILFPLFNLVSIICLVLLFKNTKTKVEKIRL